MLQGLLSKCADSRPIPGDAIGLKERLLCLDIALAQAFPLSSHPGLELRCLREAQIVEQGTAIQRDGGVQTVNQRLRGISISTQVC